MDAGHERWARLTPRDVHGLLGRLSLRWWIAGGWALDPDGLHDHGDVDVAVLRTEHEALRQALAGWDLRIAHRGRLTPWAGGPVGPPEHAGWARPTPQVPGHGDVKIETDEGDEWVYRRDASIRRPLSELGVVVEGIPYLAPDVAELYRAGSSASASRRS